MGSVLYGMGRVQCGMGSVLFGVGSIQCCMGSVLCGMGSIMFVLGWGSVQCGMQTGKKGQLRRLQEGRWKCHII